MDGRWLTSYCGGVAPVGMDVDNTSDWSDLNSVAVDGIGVSGAVDNANDIADTSAGVDEGESYSRDCADE